MKFLFLCILLTTLYADKHEGHSLHHINKELSHLELSKEQHIKIKAFLELFRTELKEYRIYEHEMKIKISELFLQSNLDTLAIDELNRLIDIKAHTLEKGLLLKIHALLTPEQRIKFVEHFDDWEVR